MKIAITGGTGQLGSECSRVLRARYDICSLSSRDLDITNQEMVAAVLGQLSPGIIINCSAFTNVDACESEPERAWQVNVDGPRNLARYCSANKAMLIHISTDYVFDGSKKPPEPYVEDDMPRPLSRYGGTKLESERVVASLTDRHCILRTAWMYGISGRNFLKTIMTKALQAPLQPIKVVNDQFGSPTWAYRVALQIERLITGEYTGTWHATAEGYCTWYDLACYFLDRMKIPHAVAPCASSEYPLPAPRPRNSILENKNLKKAGINLMCDWRGDIDMFVAMYREQLLHEPAHKKTGYGSV